MYDPTIFAYFEETEKGTKGIGSFLHQLSLDAEYFTFTEVVLRGGSLMLYSRTPRSTCHAIT